MGTPCTHPLDPPLFGQLPAVKRFMKGISELRPALPRYKSVWELSLVFTHFRGQPLASQLSLKGLLQVSSVDSKVTIKSLTTDNMELSTDKCVVNVTDKMKQTSVGTHVAPLVFLSYPADEKLCILAQSKEYIRRTSHLRNGIKQLHQVTLSVMVL